ncbi:MAG: hypothetical protein WCK33_05165 [Phycisphaerae bacterium]
MKYTIVGILIVALVLIMWSLATGNVQEAVMMTVAIVSVTFFSSIDSLWNYLYGRKNGPAGPAKPQGDNVIVVKSRSDEKA